MSTPAGRGAMSRGRICIVSHFAWGAMTGGSTGHAGGVERQTTLLARWLASRGFTVSLLTWDEGQPAEVDVDGVRVLKLCSREAGLPGLRFFHPRWTSLARGLSRADADLYYQNCAEEVTGQVALWAGLRGRPFIYSAASDTDCDRDLPGLFTRRERLLYRHGLRHADRVIVQTETQRRMMRESFGLPSVVLPMPCPGPADDFQAPVHPRARPRVVWVGRISPVKRLEFLLEVAAAMPDVQFEVAGKPDPVDDYSTGVMERARGLPNVSLLGQVSREGLPDLYRNALCLCATSAFEGLPNTFLEAWSLGLPLVSTIDPDDMIRRHGLGVVAEDVRGVVAAIAELRSDSRRWSDLSGQVRQYYAANHMLEPAMERFEAVFVEELRRSGGSRDPAERRIHV